MHKAPSPAMSTGLDQAPRNSAQCPAQSSRKASCKDDFLGARRRRSRIAARVLWENNPRKARAKINYSYLNVTAQRLSSGNVFY